MIWLIELAAALLPVVALLWYIWYRDPLPEPTSRLVKALLWGIAICLPVAFLEGILRIFFFGEGEPSTLWGTTFQAFAIAAVPEELFKLLALGLVLRNNPDFDEYFDGIVYAVYVSLGFAAVENVLYVIGNEGWVMTAVSRALLAVPGHYAFGILMGYYYSLYRFVHRSAWNAICILLVPVLVHGIYDSIAMSAAAYPYIGMISFIFLIIFCGWMHRVARRKLDGMIERDMDVRRESIPDDEILPEE